MAMVEQSLELWAPVAAQQRSDAAAATALAKRALDVVAATVLLVTLLASAYISTVSFSSAATGSWVVGPS